MILRTSSRALPSLLSASLSFLACASISNPLGPSSPEEDFLASETARYSTLLKVDVKAAFTNEKNTYGCSAEQIREWDCHSFGWYMGGTAYFYKPDIPKIAAEYGFKSLGDIACHEVAHAIYPWHRSDHWCACKKVGASPTYFLPGVPGGQIECK